MLIRDLATEFSITNENAIVGLILDTFPELENDPLNLAYDLDDDLAERLLAAHENLRNRYKAESSPTLPALKGSALSCTHSDESAIVVDSQTVIAMQRLEQSAIKRGVALGLSDAQLEQQSYLAARAASHAQFASAIEDQDVLTLESAIQARQEKLYSQLQELGIAAPGESLGKMGVSQASSSLDALISNLLPNSLPGQKPRSRN